jgi:serine protease inhibitor
VVHLADQVVVDEGYQISPDYLTALADGFGAGVQPAELSTDAGKRVLSAWINHHTGGLIRESAIQPSADLRVVLQDAILLAARWEVPFDAAASAPRPFTLPDGSVVETDTMAGAQSLAHAERDGWRAVRLPYRGGTLHADVVLPPEGTDPATASPDLLAGLDAALADATPERVDLTLPTVDVEPKTLDLLDTLRAAGAGSVLCESGASDLSGIGPEELCVGQAKQQAVLAIDEEGTVAAAVTEIGMEASGVVEPGVQLRFDRPFLIQISHTPTSWPLFLAAVRDPRH